jgi:TRAP-type C4-dicarboxylate transport system permease small subunit
MKKVLDKIAEIQKFIAGVLFFEILLINILEIISRSFFNHSFLWVADLSIISAAWMICLGMAANVHYREHLFMEILINKFPAKIKYGVNIIISLTTFAFFVMLFITGIQNTETKLELVFPSTLWPMVWVYSALPVFAFFSAIFMVRRLIDLFKGKDSAGNARHEPIL